MAVVCWGGAEEEREIREGVTRVLSLGWEENVAAKGLRRAPSAAWALPEEMGMPAYEEGDEGIAEWSRARRRQ